MRDTTKQHPCSSTAKAKMVNEYSVYILSHLVPEIMWGNDEKSRHVKMFDFVAHPCDFLLFFLLPGVATGNSAKVVLDDLLNNVN